MAYCRRRLVYTAASALVIAAYFSFINIVQEAMITAHRAMTRPQTSPTTKHQLPTVTGYSLEMQYRASPVHTCSSPVERPDDRSIEKSNDAWQHPLNSDIYLFSAHYDDRLNSDGKRYPFIRILVMTEGIVNASYYCQLWIGTELVTVTEASPTHIWYDRWNLKASTRIYRPYLFSCPVIGDKRHPDSVSLVPGPCLPPKNLLKISGSDKTYDEIVSSRKDFAVCVKGLDFPTDISDRFIEWVEIHRLLGAQHFTFYVYYVHPRTLSVLKYYQRLGIASLVEITLPGEQPNFPPERTKFLRRNTWQKRRNELVPYNDCYYRHARNFRYVIPVDIDEIIVPVQHDNWTQLFDHLYKTDLSLFENHGSFSAPQVYFLEVNQKSEDFKRIEASSLPTYTHFLRQIRRSTNFAPRGHGIKSFMSGDKCLTVFNHYALESLYSGVKRDVLLPSHLVQLNHYKKHCPPTSQKECSSYLSDTVVDLGLWKYKEDLVKNINKVREEIELF